MKRSFKQRSRLVAWAIAVPFLVVAAAFVVTRARPTPFLQTRQPNVVATDVSQVLSSQYNGNDKSVTLYVRSNRAGLNQTGTAVQPTEDLVDVTNSEGIVNYVSAKFPKQHFRKIHIYRHRLQSKPEIVREVPVPDNLAVPGPGRSAGSPAAGVNSTSGSGTTLAPTAGENSTLGAGVNSTPGTGTAQSVGGAATPGQSTGSQSTGTPAATSAASFVIPPPGVRMDASIQPIAGPNATRSQKFNAISQVATSKLGTPYIWGHNEDRGQYGFDCSNFAEYVYHHALGYLFTTSSRGQYHSVGVTVPTAAMQPGDLLIFNQGGHVGIYEGNGIMIQEGGGLAKVGYLRVQPGSYWFRHLSAVRRMF